MENIFSGLDAIQMHCCTRKPFAFSDRILSVSYDENYEIEEHGVLNAIGDRAVALRFKGSGLNAIDVVYRVDNSYRKYFEVVYNYGYNRTPTSQPLLGEVSYDMRLWLELKDLVCRFYGKFKTENT